MNRRSVKSVNNTAESSRTQESGGFEADDRNRTSNRTVTVTTHKVVKRRTVAGGNDFRYEVDPWETTPKTDYTYSRSRSYLKEPRTENYISPNMSRMGLRKSCTDLVTENSISLGMEYNHSNQSEADSALTRNLALESSFSGGTGVGGGLNGGGGVGGDDISRASSMSQAFQQSGAFAGDTYMTLRTRTLMSRNQNTSSWKEDNTFEMQNMMGTDVEEEFSDAASARGNHAGKEFRAVVVHNPNLLSRFSSLLITIVQTCVSVVTYLPRKTLSKASSIVLGRSGAVSGNRNCHSTKRQRQSMAATDTTVKIVSSSRWWTVRKALLSLLTFLFITLPVGLTSWAVFGVISSVKSVTRSSVKVWQGFKFLLLSNVTKTSRVTDAAILSRTSLLRRRCGCLCLFPLLLLVPLLLIGLLFASSCQNDVAVIGSDAFDRFSAFLLPLILREKETQTLTESSTVVINAGGAGFKEPESSENILLGISAMEQRMRNLISDLADNQKSMARSEQDRVLSEFRIHLDRLVKMLVKRELQVQNNLWSIQMNSMKTKTSDDQMRLLEEQEKRQMSVILAMRESLDELAAKAKALSEDLSLVKRSLADQPKPVLQPPLVDDEKILTLSDQMRNLDAEFVLLKTKYNDLVERMRQRPSEEQTKEQLTFLVKASIREYFGQLIRGGDSISSSAILGMTDDAGLESGDGASPFGIWLRQQFASQGDLDDKLALLAADITSKMNEKILASKEDPTKMAAAVAAIIAESKSKADSSEDGDGKDGATGPGFISTTGDASKISPPCMLCDGQLTTDDVLKLIHIELGIYDADKTGKVDYALESAGGSIISVRCSETYQLQTAQTSIFGIPLWYTYNSPRVIIQPGVHPGQCWAFTGSQGYVLVQLARRIFVTEVSIEHIPKTLSPTGSLDSAPREFEVWGLETETETPGTPLGNFTYRSEGPPIQTFPVRKLASMQFQFVELKINSNHGQKNYTCLYRFRVHGFLDPSAV